MKGPLNIILEDYDISSINGFIPHDLPLQQLDSYYAGWEEAVRRLPANFSQKTYRSKLDNLAILSTSKLHTKAEWQRAYVLLTFMTHGYIWGGEVPAEVFLPFQFFHVMLMKFRYYHRAYPFPLSSLQSTWVSHQPQQPHLSVYIISALRHPTCLHHLKS